MASIVSMVDQIAKKLKLESKNIQQYRLADQARHLKSMFKRIYNDAKQYPNRYDDLLDILDIMQNVIKTAKARNKVLNSVYISKNGKIIQKNLKSGNRFVKSSEFYVLAGEIFAIRVPAKGMYTPNYPT